MSGQYGSTRAATHFRLGRFEEAIAAATEDFAREDDNPEHLFERARARAALDRWDEALTDLDAALALDADAAVLDRDEVDDTYFSTLLAAARHTATREPEAAARRLARYNEVWPGGAHGRDVVEWSRRLRGEVRTEWTKERA